MIKDQKVTATLTENQLRRWKPLPTALVLRRWMLGMAKGGLRRKVDPVLWQRQIRAEDLKREKQIHARMKKQ